MTTVSVWILPVLIALVLCFGWYHKVPVYETFVEGAKGGFGTAIRILPHLVGMMVAIAVFRASGAMDLLVSALTPMLRFFHIPSEVVPLALLRPVSGSGSLALMTDLVQNYGPDSLIGRLASTMQGSTDTTFYILTVYFGAVGIKNISYALKVGLFADVMGIVASVTVVYLVFGLHP